MCWVSKPRILRFDKDCGDVQGEYIRKSLYDKAIQALKSMTKKYQVCNRREIAVETLKELGEL